jgi:hypothetical protein
VIPPVKEKTPKPKPPGPAENGTPQE